MNSLFIISISNYFKQLSSIQNINSVPFNAVDVSKIRENIQTIAKDYEKDEPQISIQLIQARDALFATNIYGQAFINSVALGAIVFGLEYLVNKQQSQINKQNVECVSWSCIHPLIQQSSKQLYLDGHYANAAEDAYIEINDRVKKLFSIIKPNEEAPDGAALMTTVFSKKNPLLQFCDLSNVTGKNRQQGYMEMLEGAMLALRNPKAHSNDEKLSAEESYRRLATASMLMYAIDDAAVFSEIDEGV